jgi:hypothetical protein
VTTFVQEAGPQRSESENAATSLHIRLLEERDTIQVREIMRQLHASTVFRDQEFSDWKLNEHFKLILLRPPRMIAPVAIWKGRPVGGAWAIADRYMLSDGPLFVTVHVIAVDLTLAPIRRAKVFLSLVAAIRRWAETLNASHSFIHVITGSSIAATDRLMSAAGARFVGGAYVV